MSRRNPSLGELLILAPWWVAAGLGLVAYAGLRWILPAIGSENTFLKGLIGALATIAWLPALFLGALAVIAFFVGRKKRALLDGQRDLDSLRALGWKEFEWLVGEAYRRQGYTVEESLGGGADGGIDLIIRKGGGAWLVQCKQWKTHAVGAPVVREIYGLVHHHQARGAIVITSGRFTREAALFAEGKTLELIDGPALLALVQSVRRETTPVPASVPVTAETIPVMPLPATSAGLTCPQCSAPMVRRTARKGVNAGNEFWGCSTYPKCRAVRSA